MFAAHSCLQAGKEKWLAVQAMLQTPSSVTFATAGDTHGSKVLEDAVAAGHYCAVFMPASVLSGGNGTADDVTARASLLDVAGDCSLAYMNKVSLCASIVRVWWSATNCKRISSTCGWLRACASRKKQASAAPTKQEVKVVAAWTMLQVVLTADEASALTLALQSDGSTAELPAGNVWCAEMTGAGAGCAAEAAKRSGFLATKNSTVGGSLRTHGLSS
jgi:hypothetical protein